MSATKGFKPSCSINMVGLRAPKNVTLLDFRLPAVQNFSPYLGTCVETLKPRAYFAIQQWCFHSENASSVFVAVGESLKHNNKRSLWICGWVGQGDHTIIMVSWFPKNSIFKMFSANCWNKAGFRKCSDTKSYWNSFKYHLKLTSNLSLMYLPFNTRTDSQVVVHNSLLVWVFAISCCMRSRKDSVFGSSRRHTTCVELGWVAKRWKNCLDFGGYLISTKVSASVRKTWSKRSRKWTEVFNLSLLASG